MPTVADLEDILIRRTRKYLVRCELDATTQDGSNADLRDPIRDGALAVGVVPMSLGVDDDEIESVAGFDLQKLCDVAELSLLQICWGNWAEWDQSAGEESQSLNQITKALADRIKELTAKVQKPYGTVEETGVNPGPSASGLIRRGRCYPPSPLGCRDGHLDARGVWRWVC
jgi:hypothetical protein